MYSEEIISILTIVITIVFGFLSKKSTFVSNNLIPIQNLVIGIVIAIAEFIFTKDFSTAIAMSGIFAGGTYDVFHNLSKLVKDNRMKKEEKQTRLI